jgi:starch phosphorylase
MHHDLTPESVRAELRDLAMNLWWSWHEAGRRPFAALDPVRWVATNQNPLATLDGVDPARLAQACGEVTFRAALDAARAARDAYFSRPTWWGSGEPLKKHPGGANLRVAYFCSEYALHESVQQYSGGLGVLAGDHMKSASDLGIPLCAVGLLYRHGYYLQGLDERGQTEVLFPRYDFARLPIRDTGTRIRCPMGATQVAAKVWRLEVGRVPIYLLDADLPENSPEDRLLTEGLYKGPPPVRMRQQVLLGVGGVLALEAVGEKVTVFHLNEGHAAFACLERHARFRQSGLNAAEARAAVRGSTVFTTHTPVAAGNDRYDPTMVATELASVAVRAGLTSTEMIDLGRERPGDAGEPLCMTVLALRFAERANGVSKLHGEVARKMWAASYGEARHAKVPAMIPIGAVTNGVHAKTWIHPVAETFWREEIGLDLDASDPGPLRWPKAKDANPGRWWAMRNRLRRELVHFVRERLARQAMRRGEGPAAVDEALATFREDALTIGFARRFATYKRANLIFANPKRLAKLLNDPKRPVQLVFAGKAHPADLGGQALAREVFAMTRSPEFRGKIAFVEEYDMAVGRALVSGCDVWLNNPIRPHEASGTSGMKPPLHGGLNLSILDGWWPEGFDGRNGWAIGDEKEIDDAAKRDARDAKSLYARLEAEVIPEYFSRNRAGLPAAWAKRCLRSAATVPAEFSTHRMVAEYTTRFYLPAAVGAVPST